MKKRLLSLFVLVLCFWVMMMLVMMMNLQILIMIMIVVVVVAAVSCSSFCYFQQTTMMMHRMHPMMILHVYQVQIVWYLVCRDFD